MMDYNKYKTNIPEGQLGEWKVEKFTVSEEEAKFNNLRAAFSFSDKGREIEPGIYTRLMRKGTVVMSDTPAEIRDHWYYLDGIKGNVLLNGLGLGIALTIVLANERVESVFVNDISKDVIELVYPHFSDPRIVQINLVDAFEWKPPKNLRFNVIWHDIWDNMCADNLSEMKALHRKYGHYLKKGGSQNSWGRDWLEAYE